MKKSKYIKISIIIITLTISLWSLKDFNFTSNEIRGDNIFVITFKNYGMDGKSMEKSITIPLEKRLKDIRGLSKIRSVTEYETSKFLLEMKDDYIYTESYLDIQDRVYEFYDTLPSSVQKPVIYSSSNSEAPIITLSVNNLSFNKKDIQSMIERIDGVGEVQIGGIQNSEIHLTLEPDKMATYGIDTTQVIGLLKNTYVDETIGIIETKASKTLLTFNTKITSINELNNLSLGIDGKNILLKSLGTMSWENPKPEAISRVNGIEVPVIYIFKEGSGNILSISKKIDELIQNQAVLNISKISDRGEELNRAIKSFIINILICMFIVSFFSFYFYRSFKMMIILLLSFPFYTILSISFLNFIGESIGLSSILGLGLSIGSVADSTIIMLSSKNKKDDNIVLSLISSAITTVIVTTPLLLSKSISANVYKIALSLSVFIILSTLFNIFILNNVNINYRKRDLFQQLLHLSYKLNRFKKHVLLLIIFTIISVATFLIFYPKSMEESDESQTIYTHIEFKSGTSITSIDETLKKITEKIDTFNGIVSTQSYAKRKSGSISVVIDNKLVDRNYIINRIDSLNGYFKDVLIFPPSNTNKTEIKIIFSGPDYLQIKKNIGLFSSVIDKNKITDSIIYNFKDGENYYEFIPNKDICSLYSITPLTLFKIMNYSIQGPVIDKWKTTDEKDIRIFLRYEEYTSIDEILKLPIPTNSGLQQIKTFGEIVFTEKNNTIYREDLQKALSVTLRMNSKNISKIYNFIEQSLTELKLPAGYSYTIDKGLKISLSESRKMILMLLISLYLIFFVLVLTLKSIKKSLLTLITIPLSFVVPITFIIIFSIQLTTSVFVGFIIVMGIIVNNSIIILNNDFVYTFNNTILIVKKRLASILATTGSTCIGFLPIIFSIGSVTAEIRNLALIIMGGTFGSAIISIFLLPILVDLFFVNNRNQQIV
ncbi:MAG: efflux RND transporter permease subunit [Spirochaetales bacterium]|nr:efflux RND transporter permease subunit [Spirochaetales bacterium]